VVKKEPWEFYALAALLILPDTYKKTMSLETLDSCSNRYLRWGGDGEAVQPEKD
jgi:hypothetical protein